MWQLPVDRPALMGILNVTPDSFSENGLNFNKSDAIDAAKRMIQEGADILDVGGESTRPGAAPVTVDEELRRVVPVIGAIAGLGAPISIDTRKALVARAALDAGASIVNDVTALKDPSMVEVCAGAECFVCLMHMKGEPQTMQKDPVYDDVVAEVKAYLLDRADSVEKAGISKERIWLDPGIGFGKTALHNFLLLNSLSVLVECGYPVLVGVSRKSFVGAATGAPADRRLAGSIAAQVLAQSSGVKVVRAHDVAEARQAIDVAAAILKPSSFSKHPA